jgi:hypothetical protein
MKVVLPLPAMPTQTIATGSLLLEGCEEAMLPDAYGEDDMWDGGACSGRNRYLRTVP